MIKPEDLRNEIIKPTLKALAEFNPKLYSEAAVDLLMGTAAVESRLGYNLVQEHGPALGIFQMEEATHEDIWRYLERDKNKLLRELVRMMDVTAEAMVYNLKYAAAMARIRFWYVPEALPETLEGQAAYYKSYYNTHKGAGSVEKYLAMHKKYLGDK